MAQSPKPRAESLEPRPRVNRQTRPQCYDTQVLQLNWKAAATVATGATALAGWLATPAAPARSVAPAAAGRSAPRSAPLTLSLEQEAARLALGNRAAAAFEQPTRNPFRFPAVAPIRREAAATAAAAVPESAAPQAPVFPFRLTGTASDDSTGTRVSTAVLSSSALGLVLARVGDVVADSYRIERIEVDGVDIVDVRDGRAIRLTMGR